MYTYIILDELKYRLKQPMFYAFCIIILVLIVPPLATDGISALSELGNIVRNSPYVISERMIFASILGVLFILIIMGTSVIRDYESGVAELLFTTPIKKKEYLFGRFLGSFIAITIIFIIASIGIELAATIRGGKLTTTPNLGSHLFAFTIFVIPNILFAGGLFFLLATLSKKIMMAYIGLFGIIALYVITNMLTSTDTYNEQQNMIAALIDPFGLSLLYHVTDLWSVAEKSTLPIPLTNIILYNRLLWGGIGLLSLLTTYHFFSFGLLHKKSKHKKQVIDTEIKPLNSSLLVIKPIFNTRLAILQLFMMVKQEVSIILKNKAFWIIVVLALLNLQSAFSFGLDSSFGGKAYAFTSLIINALDINLMVGVFLIIAFFSGSAVWRDKQHKFDILFDSLPIKDWMPFVVKTTALVSILAFYLTIIFLISLTFQLVSGEVNLEIGLLFEALFVKHFLLYLPWIIVALSIQAIVPNKYVGMFGMLLFFIFTNYQSSNPTNFLSTLTLFISTPYTDIAGYSGFLNRLVTLELYWLSVAFLLGVCINFVWKRGANTRLIDRVKSIKIHKKSVAVLGLALLLVTLSGLNVYYQSEILGGSLTEKEMDHQKISYEQKYGAFRNLPQPTIINVYLEADFYPNIVELAIKGHYVMVNKTNKPIERVFVNLNQVTISTLKVNNAQLAIEDNELGVYSFQFDQPLMPKDTTFLFFNSRYNQKGFKVRNSNLNMHKNGMLFNNGFQNAGKYVPHIGYNQLMQLNEPQKRTLYGLPNSPFEKIIASHTDSSKNLFNTGADWINFEAIVSTQQDQIIAGTGKNVKNWSKDSRNYYQFKSEKPMQNMFVFVSGMYETKKIEHKGVEIEVFYHPTHNQNIDFLIHVTKSTLDYASNQFGAYPYSQMRITEVPSFYSQGQSYPNMLTLTSDFGLMNDLRKGNKGKVNSLSWVLSHEIAHQWWLNQVTPAKVPGATMITEMLCEYTSMNVSKQLFGDDYVREMIDQRTKEYLNGRGNELLTELPLSKNAEQLGDVSQMYIAYQKGSVIMYGLEKLIGEDSINFALKSFLKENLYSETYSLPQELLGYFNQVTPDSLKAITDIMFNKVTLFDHKIVGAENSKVEKGYAVEFELSMNYLDKENDTLPLNKSIKYPLEIVIYGENNQIIANKKIDNTIERTIIYLDRKPSYAVLDPELIYMEVKRNDNKIDF